MINRLKVQDIYSTTSLDLATTVSLQYPLLLVDKTNPNKAEFIFKREPGLEELIESYWKGEVRIDPLRFFNQLKNIKSRLYER